MINDLYRGLQTKSNYLVALGLLAYSEAIGWIITGKKKQNYPCFEEFTKKYAGISNMEKKRWQKVRHGLAHRYFAKVDFLRIDVAGDIETEAVVADDGNKAITIYVDKYFYKFVAGVEKLLDEQLDTSLPSKHNNDGPKGVLIDPKFGKGNTLGASGPSKPS